HFAPQACQEELLAGVHQVYPHRDTLFRSCARREYRSQLGRGNQLSGHDRSSTLTLVSRVRSIIAGFGFARPRRPPDAESSQESGWTIPVRLTQYPQAFRTATDVPHASPTEEKASHAI